MSDSTKLCFSTRAIHAGYQASDNGGALNPPLQLSSTFTFESAEHGAQLFAGEAQGHFYSRVSNPTLAVLEHRIANLEEAEAGLCTASGMGAITSVLWTLLATGDEILVDKTVYGCTYAFLHEGLEKFGVNVVHVDMSDIEKVKSAISLKTKVIYFETPANPTMRLVDIKQVCTLARMHGIRTVVDNTYATPLITKPIALGADVVVHSATKYLGGHGDLIAGLVVSSQDLIDRIRLEGLKDMTGACMSPFTAMLILRGMKTLSLRMQRHAESASKIADWLDQHDHVKQVYYPHQHGFSQRELGLSQMALGGGMIAFELYGGMRHGIEFMNKLGLIQRAVSLGDAESLIQHPASMTHSTYTPEQRAKHDISDGLVRLSVGLEDVDDIIADLSQSLDLASSATLTSEEVA